MTKIKQITALIEELSPLPYAEDFDNVGLLVGNSENEVNGILVTLDCLETTVEEAIVKKCNLIVAFHPIIFKGLKKLNGKNYVERTVIKAIKNDISIFAMHTALDNSFEGVSAKMADVLQLKNKKILLPKKGFLRKLTTYVPENAADEVRDALFKSGAGHIGNYSHCSFNMIGSGTYKGNQNTNPSIGEKETMESVSEKFISVIYEKHKEQTIIQSLISAHPYEEVAYDIVGLENAHNRIGMGIVGELSDKMELNDFLNLLKKEFNTPVVRHSQATGKTIRKVAVLGGSGSFAIESAIHSGADVYVTADLKYHDFYRAEGKVVLADIGHYESEQFTKNILVEFLTKKITNFAPALPEGRIILSKINTNPINYF